MEIKIKHIIFAPNSLMGGLSHLELAALFLTLICEIMLTIYEIERIFEFLSGDMTYYPYFQKFISEYYTDIPHYNLYLVEYSPVKLLWSEIQSHEFASAMCNYFECWD